MIKPSKLKKGDTIGIVAPAAAVYEDSQLDDFLTTLEQLGFKYKVGEHVLDKYGYLAGSDQNRINDLHQMFADPEIDALIAIRGGYGCARLIPYLDYDLIRSNPKIICGYSDLTALLQAITVRTGLITYHGPVGLSNWSEFTIEYFQKILMKGQKVKFDDQTDDIEPITINPGKAKGRLYGGNLSVLSDMLGSDFLPQWDSGVILFLEEIAEDIFRVDRMLTQLRNANILDQVNGIVFGTCSKCTAKEPERSLTLIQVFQDIIGPTNTPAFYGTRIGHIKNKYTIPIGINAEIDAKKGILKLEENPVD